MNLLLYQLSYEVKRMGTPTWLAANLIKKLLHTFLSSEKILNFIKTTIQITIKALINIFTRE
jgi:hypothetical protein